MTDKFFVDDTISSKVTGDAEIVATVKGEKLPYHQIKKYYCTNCRQSLHNTPTNPLVCKRKGCECLCQNFYQGRDGKLRPYGIADNSKLEDFSRSDPSQDEYFQQLNREWKKIHQTEDKK